MSDEPDTNQELDEAHAVEEPSPVAEELKVVAPEPEKFRRNLSTKQRAMVTEQARQKVQAELAKKAKDDFFEAEVKRLREEAGVGQPGAVGGVMDDLVTFVMDLGYEGSQYIQLNLPNGPKYWHGVRYSVPRHIFNDLNYIMQAQRRLEASTQGKSVWRQARRNAELSGNGGPAKARPEVDFEETVH